MSDGIPAFGDLVEYDLTASHGGKVERAYVIGLPGYSDGDVLMLATEQWVGVPIHHSHCRTVETGHEALAERLHARYADLYPGHIKTAVIA